MSVVDTVSGSFKAPARKSATVTVATRVPMRRLQSPGVATTTETRASNATTATSSTGCKDASHASADLGKCLRSAAYSAFFQFTSTRAIAK
jgi:hypothetical protein